MKKKSRSSGPTSQDAQSATSSSETTSRSASHEGAVRETIESIAMAIILAFLFRAFVAEAFVIPTGSMAPTLMGQHKDVECPKCHFRYRAGASVEIEERARPGSLDPEGMAPLSSHRLVIATMCPLCRYQMTLDLFSNVNHETFVGDRILVSKFVYDFTGPSRWDVIVFKYPFDAKENYIKRLVGLPGETLWIRHGDVFAKKEGDSDFHITRKPDSKLKAILQVVDDTKYRPQELMDLGWPSRWQPWSSDVSDVKRLWTVSEDTHSHQTEGVAEKDIWLRYHHIVPSDADWQLAEQGQLPSDLSHRPDQLITDFYAYNAYTSVESFLVDKDSFDPKKPIDEAFSDAPFGSRSLGPHGTLGLHWVGDLALEGTVDIRSDGGELLLQLVKGGVHYVARIDAATGKAVLSIQGEPEQQFQSDDGHTAAHPTATTSMRKPGRYEVRMSNVDAEIRLWINEKRVHFDGPTTYVPPPADRPTWSPEEPGDAAPAGIGSRGLAMDIHRLRVLRDVYYIATHGNPPYEYRVSYGTRRILAILHDPTRWATTDLFAERDELVEHLGPDQFFPMGDNSPQSSDARLWQKHFFSRELLIGKALLIYWPHPWKQPIPVFTAVTGYRLLYPNFPRFRLIH